MGRFHIIIAVLAGALLLSSCSKEEWRGVPDIGAERYPVQFLPYMERSRQTKAEPGGVQENPLGEGCSFNMKSYYNPDATHSQEFYNCVEYHWDNSRYFVSSPTYYWPANGTLDFYAVSPVSITPDRTMDVTVTDGKADLIAASAHGQTRGEAVNMVFGHKLTKISFSAAGTDPNVSYEITGIKLEANSAATFAYPDSDDGAGSWSGASTPVYYEYFAEGGKLVIPVTEESPIPVLPAEGLLMLIPLQTEVELQVTYSVKYGDDQVITTTKTVDISDSVPGKWGINNHVHYILRITPDSTPIIFSASKEDWTDAGEPDVIL